jgi:hypothetical protein
MDQPNEPSQIRRIAIKSKQRKRLILLGSSSAVVLIFSVCYFVFGGIFSSNQTQGINSNVSIQNNFPLPCMASNAKITNPGDIHLRVLNATVKAGFGRAIADALALRDYSVLPPDNAPDYAEDTIIYYGTKAISHAFQVARDFYNPVLILDDRTDYLIDIVIGSKFDNLVPANEIPGVDSGAIISNSDKCVALETIQKPVALEHEPQFPSSVSKDDDSTISTTESDN